MVEVFKTNVQCQEASLQLLQLLQKQLPGAGINFDLEDCDKILRVEHHHICNHSIIALMTAQGYCCEALV